VRFFWRTDGRLFRAQLATEQREYWTSDARAYFSFALPAGLLLVLGLVNGDEMIEVDGIPEGVPYRDFLVPGMIAFAVVIGTFVALAANLTLLREAGILKRLRGTPLPMPLLLGAKITSGLANVVVMVAAVVAVGALAFDATLRPGSIPSLVAAVALGGLCFAFLGIAATRLMATSESSVVVANAVILPMAFVSGAFGPTPEGAAGRVAELLPLEPVVSLASAAFVERGAPPSPAGDLASLAVWTVVAAFLAVRLMQWDPVGPKTRRRLRPRQPAVDGGP
jgi:ABC-2 type transport system permease protein